MDAGHIRVGCEAYIVRNDALLLGKRGNVFGAGTWALPGGHLEHLERADEGLIRELEEELGLIVLPHHLRILALTDDVEPQTRVHYLHITFAVDIGEQEPEHKEKEACEEWSWFMLSALPVNIFAPHAKIFETIRQSNIYAPRLVK